MPDQGATFGVTVDKLDVWRFVFLLIGLAIGWFIWGR